MYLCVEGIHFASFYDILEFGNVPTVWYGLFFHFILNKKWTSTAGFEYAVWYLIFLFLQ